MIKFLVVLLLGYLFLKLVKNAAIIALETKFGRRSLKDPEDLVPCAKCEKYISKTIAISHKKNLFCSQECIEQFEQNG